MTQYVALRFGAPSILFFLLGGIAAGPLSGLVRPDELAGPLLQPFVSLAVAVILFEGGLSLRMSDVPRVGRPIIGLLTVGTLFSWIAIALSIRLFLDLGSGASFLIAAIVVVSGPTVMTPLLRHLRPIPPLGEILRWEAILIDPIGVVLAVLVFEVLAEGLPGSAPAIVAFGVLGSLATGAAIGFASGMIISRLFTRFLIPDHMQCGFSLSLVIVTYTGSNSIYPESGLLAVIIMGMVLRNSSSSALLQITQFFENLRELLIPGLFTLLAARLNLEDLYGVLTIQSLELILVLVIIIRPASVMLATIGSNLSLRERLFIGCVAPRGIVAASLSSILALQLEQQQYPNAAQIVPLVFLVIIGTVLIYAVFSPSAASLLQVRQRSPQGVLIVGAHQAGRAIAARLQSLGVSVLLVDSSYWNIAQAQSEGLHCFFGNILSEETQEVIDLDGIGKLLALTSNDEVNTFATLDFKGVFSAADVYQLAPATSPSKHQPPVRGRLLTVTFKLIEERVKRPENLQILQISENIPVTGDDPNILFAIDEKNNVTLNTLDRPLRPRPGDRLLIVSGSQDSV